MALGSEGIGRLGGDPASPFEGPFGFCRVVDMGDLVLIGGTTWQAARITGRGGSYAAVFDAPAGAMVTLRTTATDAAGGSIAETITNAYQIAS